MLKVHSEVVEANVFDDFFGAIVHFLMYIFCRLFDFYCSRTLHEAQ